MRVPTYASYVNLLNASLKNKEQLDLYLSLIHISEPTRH